LMSSAFACGAPCLLLAFSAEPVPRVPNNPDLSPVPDRCIECHDGDDCAGDFWFCPDSDSCYCDKTGCNACLPQSGPVGARCHRDSDCAPRPWQPSGDTVGICNEDVCTGGALGDACQARKECASGVCSFDGSKHGCVSSVQASNSKVGCCVAWNDQDPCSYGDCCTSSCEQCQIHEDRCDNNCDGCEVSSDTSTWDCRRTCGQCISSGNCPSDMCYLGCSVAAVVDAAPPATDEEASVATSRVFKIASVVAASPHANNVCDNDCCAYCQQHGGCYIAKQGLCNCYTLQDDYDCDPCAVGGDGGKLLCYPPPLPPKPPSPPAPPPPLMSSCDNYIVRSAQSLEECNRISQEMGCGDCKSTLDPGLQQYLIDHGLGQYKYVTLCDGRRPLCTAASCLPC